VIQPACKDSAELAADHFLQFGGVAGAFDFYLGGGGVNLAEIAGGELDV
jgi:hypothetical protein